MSKIAWTGTATSVQPRIRLMRSFDQRSHSYLGYVIRIDGSVESEPRQFEIALGPAAQEKHEIRVGDEVSGRAMPVADQNLETADFYKVSGLEVNARPVGDSSTPPPWIGVTPPLPTYRTRGHRRLDPRAYAKPACSACIWGCEMPVEITVDQWNPGNVRHRRETFCYGPLSCPEYRAGPTRTVPGRRGMTWEEPDWVDQEATRHRRPDE